MTGRLRIGATWPWLLLCLWAALQLAIVWAVNAQGESPIDFWTYQIAADKVARGESPYPTVTASLAIWRSYHQLEQHVRPTDATGIDGAPMRQTARPPVTPGPYIYPPTLALLIAQTGLGPLGFASLIVVSVIGFAWIWLKATGLSAVWLMLIVFSWDVFAAASGGNVELVLLAATLAASRLLWSAQPVLAAPLMAFVVLVKPFYGLFFAAFLVILLSSRPVGITPRLRSLAGTGVLALALLALEAYRWPPALRAEALDFMTNSLGHQWFVLSVAEQTPMSIWNRTPMQGLVNAGVPAHLALPGALGLWLGFASVTGWRVQRRPVKFPQAFALAFVLLYWGRPVGWTFNYLEIVVLAAVWPTAGTSVRGALLFAAGALMLSHWSALVLTARGLTLSLFTLQSAEVPWETWSVVPLGWFLLLCSLPRPTDSPPTADYLIDFDAPK